MIPFNFEYYKPQTVTQAVKEFQFLHMRGKNPMYYGGGTEMITWARQNSIRPGAVIDLKSVPECGVFEFQNDRLIIGACISLSDLTSEGLFPLLGETAQGVADQTARNQITIGGNVCGRIHFRETVLPLLLSDCRIVIAGEEGMREASIHDVFQQQMKLENGEFVVQFIIDRENVSLPFIHIKKRQIGNVGYPLVTMAALKKDDHIRAAFSGVCAFPFRSYEMEKELNNTTIPLTERVELAIGMLPAPALTDAEGTAAYRKHVLNLTMIEAMLSLEGR